MTNISMLSLCAFLFTAGTVCADPECPIPGALYQVVFSEDYRSIHSLSSDNQYVIKVDAVSKANPNWVLAEFPPAANPSYNSGLAGKRWINLNFVMELQRYSSSGQ